ncbi:MAG TPA: 3-dehydroquinate synthase II [Sedimentisphaerales bacterium]|nr:3-dehydroquinate synthase II [Sedimentisphaerales bacterium]
MGPFALEPLVRKAFSITTLKPGDKVLAHVEKAGRHFGMKVDETLIER